MAAAVLPAGAQGVEPGVIEPRGVPGSPVFAGERLLWTESVGTNVDIWSGAPGRPVERVQRVPFEPYGAGAVLPWLAASPSLALLSRFAYEQGRSNEGTVPAFTDHHVGPLSGPLESVAWCIGRNGPNAPRPADVWGEAYVYRECDQGFGHVELRDTAAEPMSPARALGQDGKAPRIAGRFVAWRAYDIVVYDRVADAEVYRVPSLLGPTHALDLQEDGKVALAFEPDTSTGEVVVGWASPEEPYLHRLALPRRDMYDVRIADDRIAFQGGRRGFNLSVSRADVGIANLDGAFRVVASNTDAFRYGQSFDFDGEQLVWREFGCEQRRLVVRDADAAGTAPGGATRCPLRLLRRPVVRRGVALLHMGCGAYKPPCGFRTDLRIVGHGGGRASDTVYGLRNPVRARLTARARRLLRRHGKLKVRATVRLLDAASREQIRRATIRLRRG